MKCMSCIERYPHFGGKFINRKRIWDTANTEVSLNAGMSLRGVPLTRMSAIVKPSLASS